ncbi:Nucleotide-binding, alpha-beta plait [Cynara cardunculus var. scolymus]|uniref:Nucleotide-binding, alpha-beta plait n=1 Tax=Cynara cardunculus var. scolymus TaxID=59895 RepID=A0A103XG85_CYNCS|nr:Nucleotide-binding, alpha-beta plait [Cynara cardunculus var. scolymus]
MGKKPKESHPEIPNSSASVSSGSIFKSLFGGGVEEPDDPTSVSIFSDSNPFRSKHTNESQVIPEKLQQVLRLDIDSPRKNDPLIPDSASEAVNKRKRKEKLPNNNDSGDSDIEGEIKKSKVESGFVAESSKSTNFDEEKKKKKRKRDEVEAEYEERKYGAMDLDLKEGEGVKGKVGEKRKELDRGEDLLVPKEGFDDEEKLLRTIFVGNLPLKVKKKALLREFSQFGEVESVRIRSIPLLDVGFLDKTPRKGAIIKKKINDAVDRVNAYIVFKTEDSAQASLSHNMAVVGGNHIHVDRAIPPRKKLKGENAPLYDSKRTEAANTVVRKHKLKIRDRELRLSHAMKANLTPSKQKESSSTNNYDSSKKPTAGNTSYQGIRASKSGGQKKFATRIAKPARTESRSENTVKRKVRSEKRPSVAARKAAANAARTGGDGNSGGTKRKPESRTPQSNSRNKKPRKFR